MTRLPRIATLLSAGLLLAACGQLIGLGDYESVEGDDAGQAGDSSGGTRGGSGGSAGLGGSGGNAGDATGGTGDRGGTGGTGGTVAAGNGGTAGDVTTAGTGGTTGGSTNEGGSSGEPPSEGGEGGRVEPPGCEQFTVGEIVDFNLEDDGTFASAVYKYAVSNLGSSLDDAIQFEFYDDDDDLDGELTGTFALGDDIDQNYETCARCVRVFQDADSTALVKTYFPISGTVTIDDTSRQMLGTPLVDYSDVTLVEVTIDETTNVSTPVIGGDCIHLDAYHQDPPAIPAEWTCPVDFYYDADCDCGCGAYDPSCSASYPNVCSFCALEGGCSTSCDDLAVDDNAVCVSPQPWTCGYESYADGVCDCGCGLVDIDCIDDTVASCTECHCGDPSDTSCSTTTVDPLDNSACLP